MFKSINGGIIPCRFTRHSAGFDVFSNEDVVIGAGETKLVSLGIALDDLWMDQKQEFYKEQHYFALHIRSSLRARGLTSLGAGIIDMDFIYPNEIKMVIHNPIAKLVTFQDGYVETLGLSDVLAQSSIGYVIKKGDKIGQLILCRHDGYLLPSEYTKDEERNGGFGSSDKENK